MENLACFGAANIHFPLANGYPGTIAALAAVDPHAPVLPPVFSPASAGSSSGSSVMFVQCGGIMGLGKWAVDLPCAPRNR